MLLLAPLQQVMAEYDDLDLSDSDKQAHLLAGGYAIAFKSTVVMRKHGVERWKAILYSMLSVIALGALKEYASDDEASSDDQVGNLLGVGISAGVVVAFDP